MRTPKRDTEVRQEQIAQAALTLVAGQGMKAMTVERVARLIGLAPSALYRHYRNKDEILDAVLQLLRDRILDNVEAARQENSSPLAAIKSLLFRHVRMIMEYQAIPRILFSDDLFGGAPERKARMHSMIMDFLAEVATLMAEGQRQGEIRTDLPADTLAVMFIGLFQPSAMLWHLSSGQFDMVRQVDATWRVFSGALTPTPGGEAV